MWFGKGAMIGARATMIGARATMSGARAAMSGARPFYLITNDIINIEGDSMAPCYLWESAKRKWIYFHIWRYWENLWRNKWTLTTASMFAWNCCWANWQYALTHKSGPLVPMLNVCTIIGTSALSIQRESSEQEEKSKAPESSGFILICETYRETA